MTVILFLFFIFCFFFGGGVVDRESSRKRQCTAYVLSKTKTYVDAATKKLLCKVGMAAFLCTEQI